MSQFYRLAIPSSFLVRVVESPVSPLPQDVLQEIKRIWQEESQIPGRYLFGGQLLSLVDLEADCLVGQFVPYEQYLAQVRNPELRSYLRICHLAVNGITRADEHLLIAKRAASVTQYPLHYELAPSGGISEKYLRPNGEIDYTAEIVGELEEETSFTKNQIQQITPLYLVFDAEEPSIELFLEVRLHPETSITTPAPHLEYPELHWVPESKLPLFLQNHPDAWVPLSKAILNNELQTIDHKTFHQLINATFR